VEPFDQLDFVYTPSEDVAAATRALRERGVYEPIRPEAATRFEGRRDF
jgi:hypothetical protein